MWSSKYQQAAINISLKTTQQVISETKTSRCVFTVSNKNDILKRHKTVQDGHDIKAPITR